MTYAFTKHFISMPVYRQLALHHRLLMSGIYSTCIQPGAGFIVSRLQTAAKRRLL